MAAGSTPASTLNAPFQPASATAPFRSYLHCVPSTALANDIKKDVHECQACMIVDSLVRFIDI